MAKPRDSVEELYSSDREWGDKPLYDCNRCAYNTLSKPEIEEHVRLSHPPTVAETLRTIPEPAPES